MFKQVNRRFVAALMAMAVVISNVIAPVSPAFATDHGTYQPVWCHLTGNSWKAQLGAQPSGGRNETFALLMTQTIKNDAGLDNVDKNVAVGSQVMAHDRSDKLDAYCAPATVSPDFTLVGICGVNNDDVTVTESSDYTSSDPVWSNGSVSVTFTMNNGVNKLFPNGKTVITITKSEVTGNCSITTLPVSTVTGVCGLNNDTIVAGKETAQYSAGVPSAFVNGVATVTYTAKAGFVFANSSNTYAETVYEVNRTACPVTITVLPKSTITGVCGLNNDIITVGEETNQYYAGVASSFVNGVATVTYTAKSGFVFAGNSSTYVETVREINTDPICVPTKPADYTTTTTKTATICLPGGGGKTTTWTTVNTYTHILIFNKWVSVLKSSQTTDQTVDASEADCPTPKQVNPTCNTLGSLTLPAYKDGIPGLKHTYYVWVNGVKTSYSASNDAVIANIPQGATVEVKLYINGTEQFGWPLYQHTFTFSTSDCIAVPQPPKQIDECGPNNAHWVVPADTNEVHWSLNPQTGDLTATAIGGKFTNHQSTIDFGVAKDSNTPCPPVVVTPVKPQITDCTAILPVTLGITYKKVYLDANGNIIDPSQASIVAAQQGVVATANAGYVLAPSKDGGKYLDNGSYLYVLDFTGMNCGKGSVTPPTVTPPVVTTTAAALPTPAALPHTGSSLSGLLVTLLATLTTYGVVYFLQPKRR